MRQLLGYFSELLGRTLGIKISRHASFRDLLLRAEILKSQLSEQKQRTARLQAELDGASASTATITAYPDTQLIEELRRKAEELGRKTAELDQRNAELVAARAGALQVAQSMAALTNAMARQVSDAILHAAGPREPQRPAILIVVTEVSQLPHLKAMCRDADVRARYKFVIFSDINAKADGSKLLEFCQQNGFSLFYRFDQVRGDEPYIRYEEVEDATSTFDPPLDLQVDTVEMRSRAEVVDRLLAEIRLVYVHGRRCQRLLQSISAQLLVLFEDNAEVESGIWVATAKAQLIPSVIMPVTISDQTEPAEYHFRDGDFRFGDGAFDRIIGQRFPHWLYMYKGQWLRRRLQYSLLAMETLGFAQPAPWVLNSSKASAIAVESAAMKTHYERLGIPDAQLRLTGSFIDDRLYAAARNNDALRRQLALDPTNPIVLCAFPPDHVALHRPDLEFATYREFIDFWLGELARLKGWQVLVKPHPACSVDDIAYMRSLPVAIAALETADLIPLCDLYTASVSSTIRWALACGKPVLNYDAYHFGYSDFANEAAVVTVSTRDAFSTELRRLSTDTNLRLRLQGEAELSSRKWGMVDGQSSARIFQLFDGLMRVNPTPGVSS